MKLRNEKFQDNTNNARLKDAETILTRQEDSGFRRLDHAHDKFKETLSRMQIQRREVAPPRKVVKPEVIAYKTVLGAATAEVDESALIRDLLFTFQNVDGENITFNPRANAF